MAKTFEEYEDEEYEGIDASLETSLYEYGLIWKRDGDDYRFVYGVVTSNRTGDYIWFDWATVCADINPCDEWSFVAWEDVARCSGMSVEDFLAMPLPMIVYDLIDYCGYENVFGSSYYPFEIEKGE